MPIVASSAKRLRKTRRRPRLLTWAIFLVLIGTLTSMMFGLTIMMHYRLTSSSSSSSQQLRQQQKTSSFVVETPQVQEETKRKQEILKASKSLSSKQFLKQSIFSKDATTKAEQVVVKDHKGNIVHKEIHSVKLDDLKGLKLNLPDNIQNITMEEAIKGRETIVNTLKDAGVDNMEVGAVLALPKWSDVTQLYGKNGPVVIGLDTCERFRNTVSIEEASIGIAGMFNTGTNPLNMYLGSNCIMPHISKKADRYGGMRFQVPWGKHTPASRKWTNTASKDGKVNKTAVLPVIMTRDPFTWMQSMCKHPYAAYWGTRGYMEHCPGLVPNEIDKKRGHWGQHNGTSFGVTVKYNPPINYESLAHYWSKWHWEYLEADYPRLIVRFEDLQFHPRELVDVICQCAGGVARNDAGAFTYVVDSAKSFGPGHGPQKAEKTNMITGMIKYGTGANRRNKLSKEDLDYAAQHFDPELMSLFEYTLPPPIPEQ